MCCEQLARSFDFTNSICGLLMNHLANSRFEISNDSISQASLLNEMSAKVAFNVLNKLTNDNKLFSIDLIVRQLCLFLIERIRSQTEFPPAYLQFLSNILRNNSVEIEKMLNSFEKIRQFCRQLFIIIRNNSSNPNLTLNSLIIVIKLNIDNMFSMIWPTKIAQTGCKSNDLGNVKIFDSIDLALFILCNDSTEHGPKHSNVSAKERTLSKPNELVTEKINALNFLYEFLKCQKVRQILEKYIIYFCLNDMSIFFECEVWRVVRYFLWT